MSEQPDRKTLPTDAEVAAVIEAIPDERRRADARDVLDLMAEVTGAEPVVWGSSMIGFGRQPYTTADGKDREWFALGLAGRKAALTLYGLQYYGTNTDLLAQLGPHTTGKGCLYVKKVGDLDRDVLAELIERAWAENHTPAD